MERPAFCRMPRDQSRGGGGGGGYSMDNARARPFIPAYQQTYESRSNHGSPVRVSPVPPPGQQQCFYPQQRQQVANGNMNGSSLHVSPTPPQGTYIAPQSTGYRPPHVGVVPAYSGANPGLDPEREKRCFLTEKEREKAAVVSQAYRSNTLILPQPKPRHDLPTGCYLRHYPDPALRESPYKGQYLAANKLQEVMNRFQPTLGPDSKVIVPYNTPLNMYGSEALNEVLEPNSVSPRGQAGGMSLRTVQSGRPAGVGAPPPVNVDITQSPTYQLIQEMEHARECGPVEGHLYIVNSSPEPNIQSNTLPRTSPHGSGGSGSGKGMPRSASPSIWIPHPHEEFPKQSHTMTSLYKSLLQSPKI